MSTNEFHGIPISGEFPEPAPIVTGNLLPLLHEIHHALENLLRANQASVIDLRGLPLSEQEYQALIEWLGEGEVSVHMQSLGQSLIRETAYSGVWRVEHFDVEGQIMARHIEVTTMPSIIKSQYADMRASLEQLGKKLASAGNL